MGEKSIKYSALAMIILIGLSMTLAAIIGLLALLGQRHDLVAPLGYASGACAGMFVLLFIILSFIPYKDRIEPAI